MSADQVRKGLPRKGGYTCSIDLKQGFHQLGLPEESRDLTTFSCEWGHYRWTKYPQGLSSSGDIFNMHMDIALHQVPISYYIKCIDNILIIEKNKKECYEQLEEILKVLKGHYSITQQDPGRHEYYQLWLCHNNDTWQWSSRHITLP